MAILITLIRYGTCAINYFDGCTVRKFYNVIWYYSRPTLIVFSEGIFSLNFNLEANSTVDVNFFMVNLPIASSLQRRKYLNL